MEQKSNYKVIDNGLWISAKELNRLIKENVKLRNQTPDYLIKRNTMVPGQDYVWWNPWNRHMNGRIGILHELKKEYENRSKTKNN